jgi:hypothetical protein
LAGEPKRCVGERHARREEAPGRARGDREGRRARVVTRVRTLGGSSKSSLMP